MITFIVGQLASKEDMVDLQRAFKVLDTNNDGMLSKGELTVGYRMIYQEYAAEEVERIFAKVDIDGSGQIDYSEWVVATIDKEKLLSPEKLQAAFNLFDKDGGGSINASEVKDVLCSGQALDDDVWDKVINEVDKDGNGEIDFEKTFDVAVFWKDHIEYDEIKLDYDNYNPDGSFCAQIGLLMPFLTSEYEANFLKEVNTYFNNELMADNAFTEFTG